jgi:regulation of enolase protein 1 (concanavalin A-like superfamily)
MTSFHVADLPAELSWLHHPTAWTVESDESGDQVTIQAGAGTDCFVDPAGGQRKDDAPCAFFASTDTAFTLSAHVRVAFAATFDAGVLQVRVNDDVWAKLCFEYSPQDEPMIVSVVTRGVSDDCNSARLEQDSVFLRITRWDSIVAFHYSLDSRLWRLVRYFTLGAAPRLLVGLSAQSPTGGGCTAAFSQIRYTPAAVADLRGGS